MKDIDGDRRERHGGGAPALPPAPELALLLREATERLARELAQPSAQAPDWSPIGWRVAMAAAVIHGIAGLLDERLRWRGPPVWQAFLTGQRQHLRLREERIRDTLRRIDAEALRDGLPVIGLKGSALLGLRAYAPGLRPMADIDLLVRPEDRLPALRMLARLGYRPEVDSGRHLTLLPASYVPGSAVHFGEHADQVIKIELHSRVAEPLPVRAVDITARILTPSAAPGLRPYPDLVALMRHLVLHTAGNMRTHTLRLVQLHDLALMAERLSERDWQALAGGEGEGDDEGEGEQGDPAWWALPPLRLAQRQFPVGALSEHRLHAFERGCPPWLRRHAQRTAVTDLSLARLFIPALPGLVWSRHPVDALRLMRDRAWPGRVALDRMRSVRDSQSWLRDDAWSQRSRVGRMASWLIDTPPSPAARFSVRQALAYREP
ncbi:nucleotidyltransferase family protein [Roseateles sp. UC29_93]|uniref:nucleotidyltransferase family protein n=1 Tax=Roseateles sp. UC29_93 TaxID=3350177 RepID=UPI00366CE891